MSSPLRHSPVRAVLHAHEPEPHPQPDGGARIDQAGAGVVVHMFPPPDLVLLSDEHDEDCRRFLGVDSAKQARRVASELGITRRLGLTAKSPLCVKVREWERATSKLPKVGARS